MESFIRVYDDLFDSSNFIELIDKGEFFNKTNRYGIESLFVNNLLSLNDVEIKNEWLKISNSLNKIITNYRDENKIKFNESAGFCLIKNFDLLNTDLHFGKLDYKNNIFGIITFLNDDYEDGEITFPFLGIKVKPKMGSAIIFPASFPFSYSIGSVDLKNKKDRFYIINWYYLSSTNHNMIDHTSILPDGVL